MLQACPVLKDLRNKGYNCSYLLLSFVVDRKYLYKQLNTYLITGRTTWSDQFSVMSFAVELTGMLAVGQVDQ